MVHSVSQSGRRVYNVNSYVIDVESDIKNLPTYCAPGSTVQVISTGNRYILNGKRLWVKQPNSAGSASGTGEGDITVLNDASSSNDDDTIVIL